jgi:predicted peptidase
MKRALKVAEISTYVLLTFLLIRFYEQKPPQGKFVKMSFHYESLSIPYRILYPEDFSTDKQWPLVFFLHGAGERGTDNERQLIHGAQMFIDSASSYPAIVIFPQCTENDWWANNSTGEIHPNGFPPFKSTSFDTVNPSMDVLESLIEHWYSTDFIDKKRIYICGISMGAMGTNQLLAKFPDRFAAGISIAGIAPLYFSEELSQTPVWVFHGKMDEVVNVNHSKEYIRKVEQYSDQHLLTLYDSVNHDSWNRAFEEKELLAWLFGKKK